MKDDLVNDTISRAAALKGLEDLNIASFYEENKHSKEAYTEVKAMLKALPPTQPGWIPVTERLPTENNSYLVWMPFTPEGHHITVAEWCGSYWNIKTPIMAWMPLPTPYREGEQDG